MSDVIDPWGTRTSRSARKRKSPERLPAPALPQPEDVFLAWCLWLPEGTDLAAAARREIARLERHAPLRPELRRLRDLFLAAIEAENR